MKKISLLLILSLLLCTIEPVFAFDIEWDEYNEIEWRNIESEKRWYSEVAVEVNERPDDYTLTPVVCASSVWNMPPAVFKTSDAVKPGKVFYLYGDGIVDKNLEILISPAKTPLPAAEPGSDAVSIDILQLDNDVKFVAAILPEEMEATTYDVWLHNDYGYSQPVRLNEAQPVFFQDNQTAQNMVATLCGRNMDMAEMGGITKTKIMIANDQHVYEMPVCSVNPFRVEFWVSENVAPGNYDVYISINDGITWVKQNYSMNEQLIVFEKTEDPFNIGLGWANQFNYENVINVRDFGAVGDGVADDFNAIQSAIDKVHSLGGGVVYMPNGDYRINGNVVLYDYVILTGQDQEKTRIIYAYDGADKASKNAFSNYKNSVSEGRIGLANFTFENDESVANYPDFFFWMGNSWDATSGSPEDRSAEYLFFKNLTIRNALTRNYANGRGHGMIVGAKAHVMIDGVNGFGATTSFVYSYCDFATVTNSDFYTTALNLGISGRFITITNNKIKRYGEEYWSKSVPGSVGNGGNGGKTINSQGIFTRGPGYIAHNEIIHTDIYGDNDGEVICTEPAGGGTMLYANINSSDKNSVSFTEIEPDQKASKNLIGTTTPINTSQNLFRGKQHTWGSYTAVIVNGRGLGQYKQIDVKSFDWENRTFDIVGEWDIVPDNSSSFIIIVSADNCYIYDNYSNQGGKGYWVYGDNIDCAVVENVGIEMEGILFNTCMSSYKNEYYIVYFSRADRNYFDKASYTEARVCSISLRLDIVGGFMRDIVMSYGNSFRENMVENANHAFNPDGESEAPDVSGINIVHASAQGMQTDSYEAIKATLVEDCTVKNCTRGLAVGGLLYDWAIDKNKTPVTAYVIVKGCNVEGNPRTFETNSVNNLLVMD